MANKSNQPNGMVTAAREAKERLADEKAAQKKKRLKIVILIVVAVVFVGAVIAGVAIWMNLSDMIREIKPSKQDLQVVAKCGDYEICYDEVRFVAGLKKKEIEAQYGEDIWEGDDAQTYRTMLAERTWSSLKSYPAIYALCKEAGIDVNSTAAADYAQEQLKQAYTGMKDYQAYLEEQNLTDRFMRAALKMEFVESTLFYTYLDNTNFIPYRKDNIGEFILYVLGESEDGADDYRRVVSVFVRNDEGENAEDNLKTAQGIRNALVAEKNLDKRLALMNQFIGSKYNQDIGFTQDGYYFTRGEMVEAYEKAAFDLQKAGDVSEVFEANGGYYVMMRLTPEEEYVTSNAIDLLENYQAAVFGQLEKEQEDLMSVELTEYGTGLDLYALTVL